MYETYLAKAKAATEEQAINNTNIRLISRAILPEQRSWPPTIPLMVGALFGGIVLGVLLALLRSVLEQFMRTPPKPRMKPEAAAKPVAPVAEVPAMGRREQLSRLRAELLATPADHCILLVRASNDEALNLLAFELACAVDQYGQKVVVIDADLKDHAISSRLRFNRRLGVRDIVAGRASIRDAAHALGQTGVQVVPVGIADLTPPNQTMRNAFSAALRQARELSRVIIDGGKLGAMPSELGLYAMVDEVIVLATPHGEQLSDASLLVDRLREQRIKAKAVVIDPTSHAMAA